MGLCRNAAFVGSHTGTVLQELEHEGAQPSASEAEAGFPQAPGGGVVLTSGYVAHSGPSSLCTGASAQAGMGLLLAMLSSRLYARAR